MSDVDMANMPDQSPGLHQPSADKYSDPAHAAAQPHLWTPSSPSSPAPPRSMTSDYADAGSVALTQGSDSDSASDPDDEYPPSFESRSASPESRSNSEPPPARTSSFLSKPDPAFWSKLPPEIIAMIVENCDRETIINWSCTCSSFYDIASNVLWRSLSLSAEALYGFTQCDLRDSQGKYLFKRTSVGSVSVPCKNDMVPFLDKKAFRANKLFRTAFAFPVPSAKLPGERVRDLRVNFIADHPTAHYMMMMSSQRHIEAAVRRLLELMPNLHSFSFEGILHRPALAALVTIRNLRQLELRGEEDSIQDLDPYFDGEAEPIPALSLVLNVRILGNLSALRKLTIGRLTPLEARPLGAAIVGLDLDYLLISSAPPVHGAHVPGDFRGTMEDVSPLLSVLKSILQHRRRKGTNDGRAGTFPLTLRSLTLRDHYRIWQQHNENVLLDTVSKCRDLTYLEIQVKAIGPLEKLLTHATFPSLSGFSMGACEHTLDWTDWTVLGLENRGVALSHPPSEIACALKKFLLKHRETLTCLTLMQIHTDPQIRDLALSFEKEQMSELWGSRHIRDLDRNLEAQMNWDLGLWSEYCYESDFCYAEVVEEALW
ncbi:MAG: hypothetical protein LQ348_003890 [Seirophora lacunosa]|nr:MAG: hypothetical protein LQ348_003890 [Seirophora lacunosa]